MNLKELKQKNIAELNSIAKDLSVEGASSLRTPDLGQRHGLGESVFRGVAQGVARLGR